MNAVYVGRLYAVQFEGEEPQAVSPRSIGVDESRGIVTAKTRADLRRGDYDRAPSSTQRGRRVVRLWYRRRRKEWGPGDRWYHDLTYTKGFPSVTKDGDLRVFLKGRDVHICDEPGDFLCG